MLDIPTQYCERLSHLGAEPLNVLSSAVFVAVAILAYQVAQPRGLMMLLPTSLGFVGFTSAWWHLYHSWAGDLADTLSIAVFASIAAVAFLYKILSSRVLVVLVFSVIATLVVGAELLTWLNGSMPYIVMLLAFGLGGIWYAKKFPAKRPLVLVAFITFVLAVAARSIDIALCPFLPVGTHFLWHSLVAIFGYQLIMLVAYTPKAEGN